MRESLACGTPFVASDVGGICEIGDDTCTILVAPEDPEALLRPSSRGFPAGEQPSGRKWRGRFLSWSQSAESLVHIGFSTNPLPALGSLSPETDGVKA